VTQDPVSSDSEAAKAWPRRTVPHSHSINAAMPRWPSPVPLGAEARSVSLAAGMSGC